MQLSKETDKLFPALFKVKQELKPVTKDSVNPHFRSNYADLNAHIELVEPILVKHGLMLLQPPMGSGDGNNALITMIVHVESGQFIMSSLNLTNVPDMQKTLAGITYARRGSINALFGLASEDDDGETAVGRGKNTNKTQSKPAPAKAVEAKSTAKSGGFKKPKLKEEAKTQNAVNSAGGWT